MRTADKVETLPTKQLVRQSGDQTTGAVARLAGGAAILSRCARSVGRLAMLTMSSELRAMVE